MSEHGPTRPDRPGRVDPRDRRRLEEAPVSLRRVVALFAGYGARVALVVAMIVAVSIVSMANPFLLRVVLDQAIPGQDVGLLVAVVGAMLAITVVTQALGVVQTWISTGVGERVMHRLRTGVFTHLQRQSLGFFTRTRGGEVHSRLINDISGVQSVITNTATSIASNLTTAVATVVAMLALSWRLTLISAVVLPPAILLTRRVALIRREITARRQRQVAELHSQVEAGLSVSGALLTKTLGTGAAAVERFARTSEELVDLELRSQLAGRWRMATMQTVFAAIPAMIYLAAGFPATSGGMTIGTLVAFTTLQSGVFRPLMGLLGVGVAWISSMALFSRIFEYLDLPVEVAEPASPVRMDTAAVRGEVVIEDVTLTYPGADRPALDGVSLTVPAGQTVAVVGATGSGKTTLAGLVARLHDPDRGRVTIDGVDVRDMAFADLTGIVGMVSQETYLQHATLRDNLTMARPDATDDDMWDALRSAQIAELVARLPDGLDTVVGARGFRFSGGEQQRIAIARTLLRDPRVLILDEATSALDPITERELQAALDALSRGRTTITIAHRLSTIAGADEVAVLDAGRVIEAGAPAELAERDGPFARLRGATALRDAPSGAPDSVLYGEVAAAARPVAA